MSVESAIIDHGINPNGYDIRSSQTFYALRNQAEAKGGNVLVVRSLSYCGIEDSSFAGCAGPGGIIVAEHNTRWSALLHAALLLHEYGHIQGLSSAISGKSHSDSEADLMYPSVTGKNNYFSSAECSFLQVNNDKFQPRPAGATIANATTDALDFFMETSDSDVEVVPLTEGDFTSDSNDDNFELSIQEFDSPFSILYAPWSKPPYELLDGMEDKAGLLDEARKIIIDGTKIDIWPNAVKVLGVYGEVNDKHLIFWFISKKEDNISAADHTAFNRAKSAAIESLGVFAGRHNDRDVLQRLEDIRTQLILNSFEDEGGVMSAGVVEAGADVSGAVVLDEVDEYGVSDALSAAITALAMASAIITPETADSLSAATVSIKPPLTSLEADSWQLPGMEVITPQNIDPNLIENLPKLIDAVKGAESMDSYIRDYEGYR